MDLIMILLSGFIGSRRCNLAMKRKWRNMEEILQLKAEMESEPTFGEQL